MTDNRQFGLKTVTINKIRSALARFESIDTAILYGSRAKGNYRVGSEFYNAGEYAHKSETKERSKTYSRE